MGSDNNAEQIGCEIKCQCNDKECAEGGISFCNDQLRFHYLTVLPNGAYHQKTKSIKLSTSSINQLIAKLENVRDLIKIDF